MGSIQMVAVLITDLVGSTHLETSVGPEVSEQLRAEHFGVLRDAIDAADGHEVKTLGDGIMAAFASAASAVDCATSLQQRLESRNRQAVHALAVRVGISAGDATHEDGDYFGLPVIEAARLCAHAAGGQVLVSDITRLLVGRRGDHCFTPIGDLELKGLPALLPTFELAWDPLPDEVPLPDRLQVLPETTYVGRVPERDLLAQLWERAMAGERQLALVYGEPGIGKTQLAIQAAIAARADGAMVLYGHCDSDFSVSYQPWIEALTHLVRHAPRDVLDTYVRQHGGDLTRLVPELSDCVADVPAPRDSEPETERYMLFTAVRQLLETVSAVVPVVLLLDDMHWADQPSLSLLRNVIATGKPLNLLVIATYRDSDLGGGESVAEVLAALRREVGVEWIGLDGLATHEVLALIEAAAGHGLDSDGEALADAVGRDTDGNPFFVVEMLRHLRDSGAISEGSDGRYIVNLNLSAPGLPRSVRDVIGQRVARLGDATAKTLSVAAVIGREFDVELLSLAAETTSDALLDQLEAAVAASVLRESPTAAGRFAFAHALINQTLYEGLSRTRKARLHRRVAEALEQICGDDPGDRLAELAHQWSSATEPVDIGRVIGYAHRAGVRALEQLAPDDALGWFDHALEHLDLLTDPDEALRCELMIRRGEALKYRADSRYREALLGAAHLAERLGDAARLTRAAVLNSRDAWSRYGEVDVERVAILRAAGSVLSEEDPQLPIVLARLAMELAFAEEFDETARPLIDRAERLARSCEDPRVLTDVLGALGAAFASRPDLLARRIECMAELTARAEAAPDPLPRLIAAILGWSTALECGDRPLLDACLNRLHTLRASIGHPIIESAMYVPAAGTAMLDGDLDRAEALVLEFIGALGSTDPDVVLSFAVLMGGIRSEQGRIPEIIDLYRHAAAENPRLPAIQVAIAFYAAEIGRLDEASSIIDALAPNRFGALRRDMTWLGAMSRLAGTVYRIGDPKHAAELNDLLYPYRDRVLGTVATATGSGHHFLGQLTTVLARYGVAEEHFAAAERVHTDLKAPFLLARTWLWWGDMLLQRGDAADRARASALLRQARDLAGTHGGVATSQEAEALLAQLSA